MTLDFNKLNRNPGAISQNRSREPATSNWRPATRDHNHGAARMAHGHNLKHSHFRNDDLGAFDLNINYDSSILGFGAYTLGEGLGDIAAGDALDWGLGDDGLGTINLAELSFLWDLSSQPDTFTLATVSFSGVGEGTSPLLFSNVILSDYWGEQLTADVEGGSISVTAPVPEPATMLLMITGLAGVFGISRKKSL